MLLQQDAIVTISLQNEREFVLPDKQYHLMDGASCIVYLNAPSTNFRGVLFSQTYSIPNLPSKVKEKYKFDNYTVIIGTESLDWYYGLYTEFELVVNELLHMGFNITRLQARLPGGEMLFFDKRHVISKLEVLAYSFIGIIALDVVSLLYIYSTIVSAPAFLLSLIDMFNLHDTISRLNVYKVFPWIGLYMHPLDGRPK